MCLGYRPSGRGGVIVRVIGLVRLKAKIELRDLTYKLDPCCVLVGALGKNSTKCLWIKGGKKWERT